MPSYRPITLYGLIALAAPQFALAQNSAELLQNNPSPGGPGNAAWIAQGPGAANRAGTRVQPLLQVGSGNSLSIAQSGTGNIVGDAAFRIEQHAGTTGPLPNLIELRQDGDADIVRGIRQRVTGTGAPAPNRLTITQQGGSGNAIGLLQQNASSGGTGNIAILRQSGSGNQLAGMQQTNDAGSAPANRIDLLMTGDRNGTAALGSIAFAGLSEANLSQDGSGNTIALTIDGDDAGFALHQSGQLQQARIDLHGNRALLGTVQLGAENHAVLSVFGDDVSARISQDGQRNDIGGLIDGSFVSAALDQAGDDNLIAMTVNGSANIVSAAQSGQGNMMNLTQLSNGNAALVVQLGDGNRVTSIQ